MPENLEKKLKGLKELSWGKWAAQIGMGLLFVPAVIFWSAVAIREAFGTDYVFDVILAGMGRTTVGNLIVVSLVSGLPAAAGGIYIMRFVKEKRKENLIKAGFALAIVVLNIVAKARQW